jgi:hypothetical protein
MKKILLLMLAFSLSAVGFTQHLCAFDELHEQKLKQDPEYARQLRANEQQISDYLRKHPELYVAGRTNETIYTIPVVVHVMHTGGDIGTIYNPTDQQIIDAIDYMNSIYSGTLDWVGGLDGAKDIGIRLVLAKRDPNCNPTNGIVRVNAASSLSGYADNGIQASITSPGVPESTVKNLSRWDPSRYYNIWVVNKINGADGTSGQFVAGYAYFPGSSSSVDGTVALATSMRDDNKILTHELGHAFNLYHPFQGSSNSSSCPSNTDCQSEGDRVCDTDPVSYNVTNGVVNFSCRTGTNPCSGTSFSPKTESNFMNYTNCFTLFTTGQKARMRAAMTLASRASLAVSTGSIPPDQSPACPAKVNFGIAAASVKETNEIPSGCSGYKDYTYSMSIVSPPSQNATVTLTPGGTATNGVDYSIYTQGNMTTPSNTIIFPPGSNTNQNFIVRVKDDADLETTENILLNFAVSGGGALKGDGTPSLNITLNDNDSIPAAPGSIVSYGIGTVNASLSQQTTPFRGEKAKHRIQSIYLASELLAAGIKPNQQITGIALNVITKNSTAAFSNFTVSVGTTTFSNLTNGFRSGLTQVFTGSLNTTVGVNQVNFSTPFTWNGTGNLVVQLCFDNGTVPSASANDVIQGQNVPLGAGVIASCVADLTTETVEGCVLPRVFNATGRPAIQLYAISIGNPVASSISSSQLELGPNADVYFFNNAGQILARIKNLSSFDYGCTTVEVDRNGTSAMPFWSNNAANGLSQKSFKVTPQNPNPNGSYEIGLYYSDAERAGYETATGQSWSTVQMVKTNGAVSSITPTNQQSTTVTVNSSASKTTFGTGQLVTAIFNNGFSGFAVGSPGTATSVNDWNVLNGVRVFPNPVSKQFSIGFDQPQRNVSVRIISAEGRILHMEKLNGVVQNHIIQMNHLNKGLYMLEIISDEGKKVLPLVKQ